MRRSWPQPRLRDDEGDARSMEIAAALAQVCDPETLERLLHAKTMLDAAGGQVFIVANRVKVDPNGVPLEDQRAESDLYETTGYIFVYEHIATALRESDRASEPDSKRPVKGIRVADDSVSVEDNEIVDGGADDDTG